MTTKICENPRCGEEFEPHRCTPYQRYCRDKCQKQHYAATHRDEQKARFDRYNAKVKARMEDERLARLGDPRMCALPECDVIFKPHHNALNTHIYCSTGCRGIAKVKGDRERLPKDPGKVPWGDYWGQNVPAAIADRFGHHVQFKTFWI